MADRNIAMINRDKASATRRVLLFASLVIAAGVVGAVGVAKYQESVARAQLDDLRMKRTGLQGRVARFQTSALDTQSKCQRLLAAAQERRRPVGVGDLPPKPDLRGTPCAGKPPRGRGEPIPFFGPYACEMRQLPDEMDLVHKVEDPRRLSELDALLRREEDALASSPVLAPILADVTCSPTSDGYVARCIAYWWKAETGEVVALIRRSTYVGDVIGVVDPYDRLVSAVEDAVRDAGAPDAAAQVARDGGNDSDHD